MTRLSDTSRQRAPRAVVPLMLVASFGWWVLHRLLDRPAPARGGAPTSFDAEMVADAATPAVGDDPSPSAVAAQAQAPGLLEAAGPAPAGQRGTRKRAAGRKSARPGDKPEPDSSKTDSPMPDSTAASAAGGGGA